MTDPRKVVKDTEKLLKDNNIANISEWFEIMSSFNAQFMLMSEENYDQYATTYEKLINEDYSERSKGKLLEDLTFVLFKNSYPALIEIRRNCRTSSNEIDLQINWSDNAKRIGLTTDFEGLGPSFLVECKNYERPLEVTYVGKFYSLLSYTKTKLGFLIAWEGITGLNSWRDSEGLIRKLALGSGIYILPIYKEDFKVIYEKKGNIFSIVKDKYLALKNDINFSKFKSKHELEVEGKWEVLAPL